MNLKVNFLGKEFKNPIVPASGCFGFGYEFADLYDINILGSISCKGTTLNPRYGNPLPRIAECPSGLINSIGLQNPGVDKVISEELVKLSKVYSDKVIANVGGHSIMEYVETVKKFNDCDKVFAIELNISCPNVSGGGMAFGVDPDTAFNLVSQVKRVSKKPLIVKLSPNVTNIVAMAQAVEAAGADAVSLINTMVGMRINLKTGQPIISVKKGGYSGPGIFPVALRMVYEVSHAISIPVIGMGGVSNAYDVLEMMYAGASLVMVGAQNLVDPYACKKIIEQLPQVMEEYNITNLEEIIGKAK
ncbi:dihydroorotate dehydrogenase (NAD+) catalytic subunit [Anaeroplasma bactoclasticum]|jgi:dihydroorotate dehydrogenase (NAD+) catalytic subunit|uniref:Dihydroorotate dehydrogenase n=1 Tax=Anaeroplasma bactoclasticum TaxID=2088 RepID=A0A397QUP2_9MOLU|nr:dihydroorotate dehydrogenase [Anaeroplasma bactoclasticum]RIA64778.1 dihydroorotate dehydrogenase (NAD+) catalytic subunit [Anaeroplasma bactoclasticum]